MSSLIRLLAVIDGAAREGDLPVDLMLRLRQRLVMDGCLPLARDAGDFANALDALIVQVRALDDDAADEPGPAHHDVPVVNVLAFADEPSATAFTEQMQRSGEDVDDPVVEAAVHRWLVAVHSRSRADAASTVGPEFTAAANLGGWHLGAF